MNRSLFFTWNNFKKFNQKNIILNFGPQHPAAHGVLRLILQLEGEVVQRTDIHIGLLHRGSESLVESKHFEKSIPYFDRMDYCSMMSQEHAFVLAIENLLKLDDINFNTNIVRVLFEELTRVLNHMLAVACHALDIGSMSSIFWAFEEREKIMEFYERISGARMHAAFHKPANLFFTSLDQYFLNDILYFIQNCFVTLNEMHNVLSYNKIWKQRLLNIGTLNSTFCSKHNLSGVMTRSCGVKKDLRLCPKDSYSNYNVFEFKSYFGFNGDSYDRYMIRMFEMGESLRICNQAINFLNFAESKVSHLNSLLWNKLYKSHQTNLTYSSMEDLINHFLHWHSGLKINSSLTVASIEAPKGEFSVSLVGNNTTKPLKCKVKSPSYYNLQALPELTKGHYLADIAALIGTIDIVFGEVDR